MSWARLESMTRDEAYELFFSKLYEFLETSDSVRIVKLMSNVDKIGMSFLPYDAYRAIKDRPFVIIYYKARRQAGVLQPYPTYPLAILMNNRVVRTVIRNYIGTTIKRMVRELNLVSLYLRKLKVRQGCHQEATLRLYYEFWSRTVGTPVERLPEDLGTKFPKYGEYHDHCMNTYVKADVYIGGGGAR